MTALGNDPRAALAVETPPSWITAGTGAPAVIAAFTVSAVRLVPAGERLVLFRPGGLSGAGGPGSSPCSRSWTAVHGFRSTRSTSACSGRMTSPGTAWR